MFQIVMRLPPTGCSRNGRANAAHTIWGIPRCRNQFCGLLCRFDHRNKKRLGANIQHLLDRNSITQSRSKDRMGIIRRNRL
tara:strand:- start:24683 stop:24925 length:243 start_codon:yes stop_codon:yes gene_type:complete